jgi:outer membrane protein
MKLPAASVLICGLLFLAGNAVQAQPKIATVDVRKILNEYHKKKEAEANLKERAADFDKTRKEMTDSYQQLTKKYRDALEGANDPAISSGERENRKKSAEGVMLELRKAEQELNDFLRRTETALDEQRRRVLDTLLTEIRAAVSVIAKAGNYTWVLNSSSVGPDNIPDFLYSSGSYDLTDEVIKKLNQNIPADAAQPKEKPHKAKP